jgi:serine protease Do
MGGATLGITARSLNEQLGEYFGAPNNEGVLVEEVEKDKSGDKAGLKAGDVIVRVGKKTVTEVGDISKEIRKLEEGDKVEVEVLRKGTKKTLTVEITDVEEGPAHLRDMQRRIRVRPHGEVFEWNSDDDPEEAAEQFRMQLDKTHGGSAHLPVCDDLIGRSCPAL